MDLLIDSVVTPSIHHGLVKPKIKSSDVEPLVIQLYHESSCDHAMVYPDIQQWLDIIFKQYTFHDNDCKSLDAALYWHHPFSDRFSQTIVEIIASLNLVNVKAVGYIGEERFMEDWRRVWNYINPLVEHSGRELIWCDVLTMSIDKIIGELYPGGTLIQRIDMDQIGYWLQKISHYQCMFQEMSLVSATQSAFPWPYVFLIARGKIHNDQTMDQGIRKCIWDNFLKFYQQWLRRVERNHVRMQWLADYHDYEADVFIRDLKEPSWIGQFKPMYASTYEQGSYAPTSPSYEPSYEPTNYEYAPTSPSYKS